MRGPGNGTDLQYHAQRIGAGGVGVHEIVSRLPQLILDDGFREVLVDHVQ